MSTALGRGCQQQLKTTVSESSLAKAEVTHRVRKRKIARLNSHRIFVALLAPAILTQALAMARSKIQAFTPPSLHSTSKWFLAKTRATSKRLRVE